MVDKEFTKRCKQEPISFGMIEASQRQGYARCFAAPEPPVVSCCLLSGREDCMGHLCRAAAEAAD